MEPTDGGSEHWFDPPAAPHATTRTQWPLVAVLWGWRCSCGAAEDPRWSTPEEADAAADQHVAEAST